MSQKPNAEGSKILKVALDKLVVGAQYYILDQPILWIQTNFNVHWQGALKDNNIGNFEHDGVGIPHISRYRQYQ